LFWYKKYIPNNDRFVPQTIIIDSECVLDSSAYRLSNYNASAIENDLIEDLLDKKSLEYINEFYKSKYSKYVLGSRILFESQKVFYSYSYAKKITEYYSIDNNIYIWPLDFDIKIFDLMDKYNILPGNIKLHPMARVYLYAKYIAKYIYFISKTFFYIEFKLLTSKFFSKKKKFKYCIQMDDGLLGWQLTPDQLIIDGENIQKEQVIFTGIGNGNISWVDVFGSKGFNVVNIHNKLTILLNFEYIKSFYKKFFILKIKTIAAIIKNPSLASALFNRYKNEIRWEAFYSVYNIDKIISTMIADDITASVSHKKNNVTSYFVYLSSTESILDEIGEIKYSEMHDYTHMMYDVFISSKFSINYVKSFDSNIKKYIEIDPVMSDIIIENSNQNFKKKILKKVSRMRLNDQSKVISFFDTPFGGDGVLNSTSYGLFLNGIYNSSKLYPEYVFLLKTKKSVEPCEIFSDKIKELKNIRNIEHANDYDMSAYEVMAASDIVVSGPEASVIHESLYAGKKTICYDPKGRYRKFKSLSHILPKCTAYNYDEFLKILHYWLSISNQDHEIYKDKYVQKFFMSNIGSGQNIKKLRECIYASTK